MTIATARRAALILVLSVLLGLALVAGLIQWQSSKDNNSLPTKAVSGTSAPHDSPSNVAPPQQAADTSRNSTVSESPTESPTPTQTAPSQLSTQTPADIAGTLLPADPIPNQLVLTFAPDTSKEERRAYIARLNGEISQEIDALNTVVITVPVEVTLEQLPGSAIVAESERDYYVSALIDPVTTDPYYAAQWALPVIHAPDAWAVLPEDGPLVTIAVIDSGICAEHEDLVGRVLPGWDFVEDDSAPQDVFGHGCGVAGIIAANIDNALGIGGIAPNAQILPLRVLDEQGVGAYSDVAAAIVYAVDSGAKFINLSLGGANPSSVLENAVNYAVSHDVVVIAAAGNTGQELVLYPARYTEVVAVGSVDSNLETSSFSAVGSGIDLLAPGRDIITLSSDGGYTVVSGTSFAAPHVTAAALVLQSLGSSLSLDGGIVSLDIQSRATPQPTQPSSVLVDTSKIDPEVVAAVQANGEVRVIINLNVPVALSASAGDVSAAVATAQNSVLSVLGVEAFRVTRQYTYVPALAGTITQSGLDALQSHPDVALIQIDMPIKADLNEAQVIIHSNEARAQFGVTGQGVRVAVVDTGVDTNHPDLSDDIVAQQCFTDAACPPNNTDTGSSAEDDFGHGTHVAGIITASSLPGVAPDVEIVAVKVLDSTGSGWNSDIIAGLDWIRANQATLNVDIVNMSLGGGSFSGYCDASDPGMANILGQLKNLGIATFASSGNSASSSQMGSPACITHSIAVGATYDYNGTYSSSTCTADLSRLTNPGRP